MTIQFEIADLPKTTNSGGRAHWAMKAKEAKKWKNLTKEAFLRWCGENNYWKVPDLKKAKLTLTRCSAKEPDADGLVSSFKHVIDGLVEAGVIIDDKPSVIGFPNYAWEYARPKQGKIKVKVEALLEKGDGK